MALTPVFGILTACMLQTSLGSVTVVSTGVYTDSTCTAANSNGYSGGGYVIGECVPAKDSANARVYEKTTCNATHAAKAVYTDSACTTAKTGAEGNDLALACTDNGGGSSYIKSDCTTTIAADKVVILMKFSDSACTDANFVEFMYLYMDRCNYQGASDPTHYKWECSGSALSAKYYTDKTCGTASTAVSGANMTFGATCSAFGGGGGGSPSPSPSVNTSLNGTNTTNVSGGRRLAEGEEEEESTSRRLAGHGLVYYKLYKGCGVTGTLPSGISKPAGATATSAGINGAQKISSFHSAVAALVAAVFVALC